MGETAKDSTCRQDSKVAGEEVIGSFCHSQSILESFLFGQWLLNPRLCGLTIDHEEQKKEELKKEMEFTGKDVLMISKVNTKD